MPELDAPSSAPVRFERTVLLLSLLHAACRFVPVPLADEWLQTAVLRQLVRRALQQSDRSYAVDHVRPLFDPEGGCLSGCLAALPKLVLKLVLFPIRKILAWVGAVRGVTRDLTSALLLSRSVERCLAAGRLVETREPALLREALVIRGAFDLAIRDADLRLTRAALRAVLSGSKGLLLAAVRAAGSMFRRDDPLPVEAVPEAERPTLAAGTERIESALTAPAIHAEIVAFDRRFDQALATSANASPMS